MNYRVSINMLVTGNDRDIWSFTRHCIGQCGEKRGRGLDFETVIPSPAGLRNYSDEVGHEKENEAVAKWRSENWGTSDFVADKIMESRRWIAISFFTWVSEPHGIYEALAEQYPALSFRVAANSEWHRAEVKIEKGRVRIKYRGIEDGCRSGLCHYFKLTGQSGEIASFKKRCFIFDSEWDIWKFDFNALVPMPESDASNRAEWRLLHWGTSWEGDDLEIEAESENDLNFHFYTSDSPATGVFDSLAKEYPNLRMEYSIGQGGFYPDFLQGAIADGSWTKLWYYEVSAEPPRDWVCMEGYESIPEGRAVANYEEDHEVNHALPQTEEECSKPDPSNLTQVQKIIAMMIGD